MGRKDDKPGKITFSSPEGAGSGRLKRFVVTVVILLVIVMTFFAVAIRTEAGLREIEKKACKYAGTKVTIERVSIGLPYVVVLEGIETDDFDLSQEKGFRIEELRIGFVQRCFLKPLSVKVNGCWVFLVQDNDQNWKPGRFAAMGNLPLGNISEVTELTYELRKVVDLEVNDAAIMWKSNAGAGAVAKKIDFEMSRIKVPGRLMYYYSLSVLNVLGADGVRMTDVNREWLATDRRNYIEIARSEDVDQKSQVNFWEGNPQRGDAE